MTTVDTPDAPAAEKPEPSTERSGAQTITIVALVAWVAMGIYVLTSDEVPSALFQPTDVFGHAMLFFWTSLAALTVAAALGGRRVVLLTVGALIAFAVGTELLQPSVTDGRQAEASDLVANLVGLGAAGAVLLLVRRIWSLGATARRRVAAACLLALAATAVSFALGSNWATVRWECRGVGYGIGDGRPLLSGDMSTPRLAENSDALRCDLARGGGLTAELLVETNDLEQTGPVRFVTSSEGTGGTEANFHVGQDADALSIRLRTTRHAAMHWILVPGVFTDLEPKEITVHYSDGTLRAWVDGDLVEERDLPGSGLLGWDTSYPILIGDEVGGGRAFDGQVSVEIFAGATGVAR